VLGYGNICDKSVDELDGETGGDIGGGHRRDWERITGRVESLGDVLKVWENQQERRVGRSLIFELGVP